MVLKKNSTEGKNKQGSFTQEDRNNLLHKLINNVSDHIYIKDKRNRYVFVNKARADFIGKKPKDFIGKTDFNFLPSKSAKVISKNDELVIKNEKPISSIYENIVIKKKEFWFSCNKTPWFDKKGNFKGVMSISREVTKRKKIADDAIDMKNIFFKALMDNIPDSIYFKDKKSRFVLINKALSDKFGLKKQEDAIGLSDFDFFEEKLARPRFNGEQRIIKTGKPFIEHEKVEIIEGRSERWVASSKIPWYDEDNKIIGIVGITRDITERKKAQEELVEKKNQLQILMDFLPDSIFIKNKKSEFILNNKTHREILGLTKLEDVIGKTDFDIFPKKQVEKFFSDEQNVIKTGIPMLYNEEVVYHKGKKKEIWLSTSKVPFKDAKGNIIGIIGISRDITEKKKAEEKIKYLSFHDVLTGLYNRAYFEEEIKRLDTGRQLPITVVMGDVNGLKLLNDAYGHDMGDILLRKISEILKESFREEDIVSRWGGDEFIAILPKTSTKDTEDIIKRITPHDAKPGAERGMIMRRNAWKRVQPSTRAASTMALGTPLSAAE